MVMNGDARPEAHAEMQTAYRLAWDYTYDAKYGIRNWQGGGRDFGARDNRAGGSGGDCEESARGAFSRLEIIAYVRAIHELTANVDSGTVRFEEVESNIVRCPDSAMVPQMIMS